MRPVLADLFETLEEHLTEGRDYVLDATKPEGGYDPESLLCSVAHLRRALLTLDDLRETLGRLEGPDHAPQPDPFDEPQAEEMRKAMGPLSARASKDKPS